MPRDLYLCSEMKSHSYCVIKISYPLCARHYHKELFYFLKSKHYMASSQVCAVKTSNRMVHFFSLIIIRISKSTLCNFVSMIVWYCGKFVFPGRSEDKKFSAVYCLLCAYQYQFFLTVIYKQCSVSCSVHILSENF